MRGPRGRHYRLKGRIGGDESTSSRRVSAESRGGKVHFGGPHTFLPNGPLAEWTSTPICDQTFTLVFGLAKTIMKDYPHPNGRPGRHLQTPYKAAFLLCPGTEPGGRGHGESLTTKSTGMVIKPLCSP